MDKFTKAFSYITLITVVAAASTAAEHQHEICAYNISGLYAPSSRYLYYALILVGIVFHRIYWLANGTLVVSMIYSSTATIHAIAIAATRGQGTMDLDAIPVFAIIGAGMLSAPLLLLWSKTLWQAATATRGVVFMWIVFMNSSGILASLLNLNSWPAPITCDAGDESCATVCNITLPIRTGQDAALIPFQSEDKLSDMSRGCACLGTIFTFLGLISCRRQLLEQAKEDIRMNRPGTTTRELIAGLALTFAWGSPAMSGVLLVILITTVEPVMTRLGAPPEAESMSVVGQWGPLVGAVLVGIGLLLRWALSRYYTEPVERQDIEMLSAHSCYSEVFRDGAMWGPGTEGVRLTHAGVEWVVDDGILRKQEGLGLVPGSMEGGSAESSTAGAGLAA